VETLTLVGTPEQALVDTYFGKLLVRLHRLARVFTSTRLSRYLSILCEFRLLLILCVVFLVVLHKCLARTQLSSRDYSLRAVA